MNFAEHYFSEKKKSKKKNKKKRKGGYNHSSYFNSKNYDKGVHGTLDLNLIGL